jgi:hypothetical protein
MILLLLGDSGPGAEVVAPKVRTNPRDQPISIC